jgi:hypothetical protein
VPHRRVAWPQDRRGLFTVAVRPPLVVRAGESSVRLHSFLFGQPLRPKVDGQLVDLSVEAERYLVVVFIYRSARVHPNVEGLGGRQEERNRFRNRLRAEHVTIDCEHASATLREARAVVLEFEDDRVLSWRERLVTVTCPAEHREHDQVVAEHRLAFEQVQPVAAKLSPIGDDHSVATALRDIDLGSDRK